MTGAIRVAGVSILFCDLVGSTALLDAIGEARNDELRRDLFEALRAPLPAFAGREVKSAGDGLMVSFTSSPTDAIGCAVAMQQLVATLDGATDGPQLAIRIGVSAGEVTSEDDDWFGTPVVEAARLCSLAAPEQILVTDRTAALLAPQRPIERLGLLRLKGFNEPVACSAVDWDRTNESQVPAPVPPPLDRRGHARLVGRRNECGQAERAWSEAVGGDARVLLVGAPPRGGRSRFAAEVAVEASDIGAVTLYGAAKRVGAGREDPFVEALRRLVLWVPDSVAADLALVDGFERLVPACFVRRTGEQPPARIEDVDPHDRRRVVDEALDVLCTRWPVLVVVEDLQWGDEAALDTLFAVACAGQRRRLLVVATYRSGHAEGASRLDAILDKLRHLAHVSQVTLPDLSLTDVATLVSTDSRLGGHPDKYAIAAALTAEVGAQAGDVVRALASLQGLPVDIDVAGLRSWISRCVPYKGLVPFGPNDTSLFFGRDRTVNEIVARLRQDRFVVLVGGSGSGKSSILKAGLTSRPGELIDVFTVITPADAGARGEFVAGRPPAGGLVVDQFEEVFTLLDQDERSVFIDAVLDALDFGPVTWLAIGVRGDFYGHLADHQRLAGRCTDHSVLVGQPTDDELTVMIEAPALVAGLRIERGLTDIVLADVRTQPNSLPLLSHAMLETWRRRIDNTLTIADFRDAGGVRAAIGKTADHLYTTGLDGDQQAVARSIFLRSVDLGDDARPTRRPVYRTDLLGALGPAANDVIETLVAARLLVADDTTVQLAHEALITEWPRLIGWLDAEADHLRVTAALSRAAIEWDASGQTDNDLYRGARLDAALALAGSDSPLTPREHAFLLASDNKRRADNERLRRTNRRLRRLLAVALSAITLTLTAGGLAVLQKRHADRTARVATTAELLAEKRRRSAELDGLSAEAKSIASSDPALGSLLAAEAYRLSPTPRTLGNLEGALRTQPSVVRSIPLPLSRTAVLAPVVSHDRRHVAVTTSTTVVVLSFPEFTVEATIPAAGVRATTFSPDSAHLAMVVVDGTSRRLVVDGLDGKPSTVIALAPIQAIGSATHEQAAAWSGPSHILVELDGALVSVALESRLVSDLSSRIFEGDPSAIATSEEGHVVAEAIDAHVDPRFGFTTSLAVRLMDEVTHEQLGLTLKIPAHGVQHLTFSDDGRFLAVGSRDRGVFLIDVKTLALVEPRLTQREGAAAGYFDSSGQRIAVVDATGALSLFDLSNQHLVAEVALQTATPPPVPVFAPADLVVVRPPTAEVIALDDRQPLASASFAVPGSVPLALDDRLDAYVSTSGYTDPALGTGSLGAVDVYDAQAGDRLRSIPYGFSVWGPARDGSWVLGTPGDSIQTRTSDNQIIGTSPITSLAISNRAATELLTVNDGGEVGLLTLPNLKPVVSALRSTTLRVTAMALSDDGTLVAIAGPDTAGRQQVQVDRRSDGGQVIATQADGPGIANVDFTPDGRTLLVSDNSGTLSTISLPSGHISRNAYRGMRAKGYGYYNADGTRVIALGTDGTAWQWDAATGQAIGDPIIGDATSLLGADDQPIARSDTTGTHILIVSTRGLQLWNLDTATWSTVACQRAGRNLTESEWKHFLPTDEPYHKTCPG